MPKSSLATWTSIGGLLLLLVLALHFLVDGLGLDDAGAPSIRTAVTTVLALVAAAAATLAIGLMALVFYGIRKG